MKGLYRQLTAATTLCTGRAAPLSTCGNKPVCGNALLVSNKNGARGSVLPCRIHPGHCALARFPPLPTRVCTASLRRQRRCALAERHHYPPVVINLPAVMHLYSPIKTEPEAPFFHAVSIPDAAPSHASRSLANKGLYRQLTTATTLCTGRAAPLSTCGNKPACDNALLVTNKNGARGSVLQCRIHSGRSALARFPPLPARVCTASSRRQRRCALAERHHCPPVVINLSVVMHF